MISTANADNLPTMAVLPSGEDNSSNKNDENTDYSCPRFPNKRAAQEYLISISPPRDLICPITQELFSDPVVAIGDGCTYERTDIQLWFRAQQSSNGDGGDGIGSANSTTTMIRSPVSNAFMHGDSPGGLVENRVVAGLARSYRENLGRELCNRCDFIHTRVTKDGVSCHVIGDGGFRIKSLVEAGADLSLKACPGGNTAFMMVNVFSPLVLFCDELFSINIPRSIPLQETSHSDYNYLPYNFTPF